MGLANRWRATRAMFKPRDVEEAIDFYFHRPIAGLIVQAIRDWPITPNQVTLASGAVSFSAGLLILLSAWYAPWLATIGGGVLFFSVILDCADGQLARLKGSSGVIGRILDGLIDAVAPLSVMPAMLVVLLTGGAPPIWVWSVGWAAGLSLLWHAQIYDVSKNLYLHATRPDFNLGGDTIFLPEKMETLREEMVAEGRRREAFVMRVWVGWTKPQLKLLRPWASPERTPRDLSERDLYLSLFRPVMAATTWLGFGTHLFILYLAALVIPWYPEAIWIAWGLIAGPLNVVALVVKVVRARRERRFLDELAAQRAA